MTRHPRHSWHPGDGTSADSGAPAATTRSAPGISYVPLPGRHATDDEPTAAKVSAPSAPLSADEMPVGGFPANEYAGGEHAGGSSSTGEATVASTEPHDNTGTAVADEGVIVDSAAEAPEASAPASDSTARTSWSRRRTERKEQRKQHRTEKAQRPRQQRFPWVLRGWGRRKLREAKQRWRQSLQFRTVTTTIVLATLILTLTLFGLSAQIAQRILDSKVAGAERDLSTARLIVESQLNGSDRSATDETRMASALAVLTAQGPPFCQRRLLCAGPLHSCRRPPPRYLHSLQAGNSARIGKLCQLQPGLLPVLSYGFGGWRHQSSHRRHTH